MLLAILLFSAIPICQCVDHTYTVKEGKSPGTLVGDIAADAMQNLKNVIFKQLPPGDATKLFRIDRNTGKLYTAQTLDAEALCQYNIKCFRTIDVTVQQSNSVFSILEINVIIEDINDNAPTFPVKQFKLEFSENDGKGLRKSIPGATDKDIKYQNSQISYELKKDENEPFLLDVSRNLDGTSELKIELQERLDREIKETYKIQVIAKDGGQPPQQNVLDLHISVIDTNDNPPIFPQNVYNVSIKYEHEVGIAVIILTATDADDGENGKISYQFSSKTSRQARSLFKIDKSTGEIFLLKKLSQLQQLTYKLYIKATDHGNSPLSSIAIVNIVIVNQQNNPPKIFLTFLSSSAKNTVSVPENISKNSLIANVKVSDDNTGQNGDVSCELKHDKFKLRSHGPKRYIVSVQDSLDRETNDRYDITIICRDHGSPRLQSESQFTVKVTDVNDVAPTFPEDTFKFVIEENLDAKHRVGVIKATDPDLGPGGQLTYSLTNKIPDKTNTYFLPFRISEDGVISTVMSLDYELQNIYKFQVLVKDGGQQPLNNTVNVVIEVSDKNDNAPRFIFPSMNPYTLEVVYYRPYAKNITTLKATDADSRENAFLKYEIISGNRNRLFKLNHYSGLLSFSRVLNHQDAGSYKLEFSVEDNGIPVLSATTTLTLKVSISNKTKEVSQASSSDTSDGIHMYLLIIIVFAAVTVSVIITAPLTICIVKLKDRRNAAMKGGAATLPRCGVNGHAHMPYHPQLTDYFSSGMPVGMATDISRNTLPKRSRRGPNSPGLEMRTHPGAEVIYEEIEGDRINEERAERTFMVPDCHSDMVSYHTDSGHGWSEGDTGHIDEMPDLNSSVHCKLNPSVSYHVHSPHMKPVHQAFDTSTLPRYLYKPNASPAMNCREWPGVKPVMMDGNPYGTYSRGSRKQETRSPIPVSQPIIPNSEQNLENSQQADQIPYSKQADQSPYSKEVDQLPYSRQVDQSSYSSHYHIHEPNTVDSPSLIEQTQNVVAHQV